MENLLRSKYYDAATGFVSAQKLYEKVKDKGVTLKQVQQWLDNQESVQVSKEVRRKEGFKIVGSKGDWQADLTFYPQYKGSNNGYETILTMIEIPSRKAFAKALIRKNKVEMIKALEQFKKKHFIKSLTTDNGSEFVAVQSWCAENNIEQWFNEVGDHHTMGLIERFNRTLRNILERYFTAYHHHKWVNILDDVITNYNNTKHRTIGCTPNEFEYGDPVGREHNEEIMAKHEFKPGDRVRIALEKAVFSKGAVQKWSTEVYEVLERTGYSYILKGKERTFKFYELQKVIGEVERLKTGLRTATRDKKVISDDKMIKKIMRELGVSEEDARELHNKNQR